jgi:hypothetical protein
MNRWVTFGSVLWLFVAAPPADLFAEVNPAGNRYRFSYPPGADPRERRVYRERAVAKVGREARDFVETQGDEAVAAIFRCSKPVAVNLAGFHASGEMAKLPRPRDLLRVIGERGHGDDVALWAIAHARELIDADSFEAYLNSPLEYALGLKQMAAGAAEARANRLTQAAMATTPAAMPLPANETLAIAGSIAFFVILGLLVWRRKRASIY